jgi:hypothetical protein
MGYGTVITAASIGADPAGSAAAAQAAAALDATAKADAAEAAAKAASTPIAHATATGVGVHGATAAGAAVLGAANQGAAQTAIGTDAAGATRPPTAHAIDGASHSLGGLVADGQALWRSGGALGPVLLGDAATKNVGTGAGDVAAGDVLPTHAGASGAGVHGAGATGATVLAAATQAAARAAADAELDRGALRLTLVAARASTSDLSQVTGSLLHDQTLYSDLPTVTFRAAGIISGSATGEIDLYDLTATSLLKTLVLPNGSFAIEGAAIIPALPAGAHVLEARVRRVGGAATDEIFVSWAGLVLT